MPARATSQEILKPSEVDPTPEPIWYHRSRKLYHGKYPPFYDVSDTPCGKALVEHYDAIRDELLAYWAAEGHRDMPPEDVAFSYVDEGWRTMSLYASGYKHRKSAAKLPVLTSVLEGIPNMVGATVSVLRPQVRIHAHVGGTSATIRTHLGISIPGDPPDVAIRVGGYTRGWRDGEVFGIETARRHVAWNRTDEPRIAIMVDTIKDEYVGHFDEINGRLIGLMAMYMIASRFPVTKRTPEPVLAALHTLLGIAAAAVLKCRRFLRLQPRLPSPTA